VLGDYIAQEFVVVLWFDENEALDLIEANNLTLLACFVAGNVLV
jgi:hypothetical protein